MKNRPTALIILLFCFPLSLPAQITCDLQWFQVRPPASPDLLINQASAYDSRRGVAVLFGGGNPLAGVLYTHDTWEFAGGNWTKRLLSAQPPTRQQAAMAYDSDRGVCVLFGGGTNIFEDEIPFNDTWEWDGTIWRMRQSNDPSAGNRPPPLDDPLMAYDSFRKRIVLIGGHERLGGQIVPSKRTWEWDGNIWTVHDRFTSASPAPPPRGSSAMAFDPIRRVTVVFGGSSIEGGALSDTWVWDGGDWKEMPEIGPVVPADRAEHAMAFDPYLGVIVLFGGAIGGDSLKVIGDTWKWDGRTWTNLPEANQTGNFGRRLHRMWYDYGEQRMMVFGGTISFVGDDGALSHQILNDLYEARVPGRWVDFNYLGQPALVDISNFYAPYNSLRAAVDETQPGCTINIKAGSSAETITITKPLTLRAYGGPVSIGGKFIPN